MKLIALTSRTEQDWSHQWVDDSAYDVLLEQDATVLKPDGSPLLVFLKGALSAQNTARAWRALKDFKHLTDNRGTASGFHQGNDVKKDGTRSRVNRIPRQFSVNSGVIGYFERNTRFPYCRQCAWNQHSPEKFAAIQPMIQEVSDLFRSAVPERYEAQARVVERTSPDFVIPGTVYTTLTVNVDFRTACHKDAGDLPEGFSALTVFRAGRFSGGALVFPDFRVAADVDTTDAIFFDPHEFHGNTELTPLTEGAKRLSLVYYYRDKMRHCGSAAEELSRAQRRAKGDALV